MLTAAYFLFIFLLQMYQIGGIINRPAYTPVISYRHPLWVRKNITSRTGVTSERVIPFTGSTEYVTEKQKFFLQKPKPFSDMDIENIHGFNMKGSKRQSKHVPTSMSVISNNIEMPFFDNMPGDTDIPPIFIYNMPSGEMIVNTMMSKKKFPMKEPVPGQVLYPPTVPLFKPIPIVNQLRSSNEKNDIENLTLIPFYEHEALDYPTSTTTSAPKVSKSASFGYVTSRRFKDQRRGRKERPYVAYNSPEQVNWKPYIKYNGICTTPFPAAIPNPLRNHRLQTDFEPTSPSLSSDVDSDISDNNRRLNIIYEEEEEPKPKLSSRYSVAKEYLAFPVFSLGKLLNTPKYKQEYQYENKVKTKTDQHKQKNDTDTWFIINSRYKGHQSKPKLNQAYLVDTYNSQQQYLPEDA